MTDTPRLYISTITANMTTEYRALPKPHPGAVAYLPEGAGVRVKPLEWDGSFAATGWGGYSIGTAPGPDHSYEWFEWRHSSRGDYDTSESCWATEDEAKIEAQADYESRIMAALEPMEPVAQDYDPPCTDCDDTGITHQTERFCTCHAGILLSIGEPSDE